ncbi:hypothetical protein [Kitasatospora sp. NPDC059160]|uniref:hypothetical protein n=1 Tax=Kitasatospora sp. NPDC059160 TaxID=3346748 RepID=UPI0036A5AC22
MPKKQSTASKKARTAARGGEKFTEARRAAVPVLPATVLSATEADAARYGWDELVVSALASTVDGDGVVPVRTVWPEWLPASADHWGVAEPAVDGWLIHQYPSQAAAVQALTKGQRVPVPYHDGSGRVRTAALWPLVMWPEEGLGWEWAHTGWSVERPGRIVGTAGAPFFPSTGLPFEVRRFDLPDGVLGEDYTGSAPRWSTWAWCADREAAVELAEALVAHRLHEPKRRADSGTVQAQVWQHGKWLNDWLNDLPALVHTADADPNRPVVPRLPFNTEVPGRPASAPAGDEPTWRRGEKHPPSYELRVWDTAGSGRWVTLGWFLLGRTGPNIAADLLRVGAGGRYPWAETWGPHHPDAWAHDWTEEGRAVTDHHPDMSNAEDSARLDTYRRERDDALAAALAARSEGRLTVAQATQKLQAGGQEYRDRLRIGQVVLLDVLHNRRRDLPEGPERTKLRRLTDNVEERHEVPGWLAQAARDYLAADPQPHYTPGAKQHRIVALEEYLSPGR